MAWTSPRTWVTGELVTAAIMNTHVRDNLLEAAPAKVTSTGDIVYATAANALARLAKGSARQGLRQNAALTAPEWSAKLGSFFPIFMTTDSGAYLLSWADASVYAEIGAAQTRTYLVRFYLDFDNLPATQQTKLHAVMWVAGGTGPAHLRLRNISDGVNYDDISTAATSPTFVRSSSAFNLPTSADKQFTLQGMTETQEGEYPNNTQCRVLKAWLELL